MYGLYTEPPAHSYGTSTAGGEVLRALFWMGVGAALMYVLDPQGGARRRALARDKAIRAAHVAQRGARGAALYGRDRARGAWAEARARMRHEEVGDRQLAERVRAAMGRAVSHPGAIEVEACDGAVMLTGSVLSEELDTLIETVADVHGVEQIEDHLQVYQNAGGIPALQG